MTPETIAAGFVLALLGAHCALCGYLIYRTEIECRE